ncbi:MAG: retinal pigment epithelial membrane protein-domain-containing protein [Benniella sp.]|nr:MAG: retinal pigment epithelial membrane protein-domain-containing protein [Benniella sp.]
MPEVDTLPKDLVGIFFRSGPGNKLVHPIDGDGLIVALPFTSDSRHCVEEQAARKMIYRDQMGTDPNSFRANVVAVFKNKIGWEKSPTAHVQKSLRYQRLHGKVLNAHETNLTAVCLGKRFTMEFENKTWLSNASKAPGLFTGFQVRFGDATNAMKPLVHQTVLHPASVEFPAVHPYRHGLDTRYTYMMASSDPKRPHYFTAVLKHDLHGKGTKFWESEGVTGEPCFIPRGGYAVVGQEDTREEDDGFVVVQVYHPKTQTTDFAVLDAQTMELLATIALKHHVPFGFHGTFTPELFLQSVPPPSLIKAKI